MFKIIPNSRIIPNTPKDLPFPKIMIRDKAFNIEIPDRIIVLFLRERHGFILDVAQEKYNVATYSQHWIMEQFSDYDLPITLQNDKTI